ncbi:MAG: diaminopimelate epimerase [Sphingomonadales bacterium]
MSIPFVKYQGTGNDFILIDARNGIPSGMDVARLCHRHYGIGADGLMYLTSETGYDFGMVYYNSDGKISSMCGNGGRCIAHFAHNLGLGKEGELHFLAVDGPHYATVSENMVVLQMKNVTTWEMRNEHNIIVNTGSPHYVSFIKQKPESFDLIGFAHSIRYGHEFSAEGINVNIVMTEGNILHMRTYERGVEAETLSCGTGVTAAALSHAILNKAQSPLFIQTPGGELSVSFVVGDDGFSNINLMGPATRVFSGIL